MSLTVEDLSQVLIKDIAAMLRQAGHNEPAAKLTTAPDTASRLKLAIRALPAIKENRGQSESADTTMALATAMAVLERAFVESIEGSQLITILKELILRMDHELVAASSQRKTGISKSAVDASVEKFFQEVRFGIL